MAAVASAIALGYRSIDTAHEYGNQAEVGTAVRAALANSSLGLKRADLFVIIWGVFALRTMLPWYQSVQISRKAAIGAAFRHTAARYMSTRR